MHTVLKSNSTSVSIGSDKPFVVIGEKINPTGSKKLRLALLAGNLDLVVEFASKQVAWGAAVLDVNVGQPGVNEAALMSQCVQAIISKVDIPLCIDSSDPAVLEAGLKAAPGKPLVNSVNAEPQQLNKILPVVKDRGAALIGLTIDENGIPKTAEGRASAAEKIINRSVAIGIPLEDIIIDPLVLSVGADSQAARVTLQTIGLLIGQFGVNINLGASNVSYGLPDRATINAAFLALAMQAGATCSITDPIKFGSQIRATDVLLGKDNYSVRYLQYYRVTEKLRNEETEKINSKL